MSKHQISHEIFKEWCIYLKVVNIALVDTLFLLELMDIGIDLFCLMYASDLSIFKKYIYIYSIYVYKNIYTYQMNDVKEI